MRTGRRSSSSLKSAAAGLVTVSAPQMAEGVGRAGATWLGPSAAEAWSSLPPLQRTALGCRAPSPKQVSGPDPLGRRGDERQHWGQRPRQESSGHHAGRIVVLPGLPGLSSPRTGFQVDLRCAERMSLRCGELFAGCIQGEWRAIRSALDAARAGRSKGTTAALFLPLIGDQPVPLLELAQVSPIRTIHLLAVEAADHPALMGEQGVLDPITKAHTTPGPEPLQRYSPQLPVESAANTRSLSIWLERRNRSKGGLTGVRVARMSAGDGRARFCRFWGH
jgi:hypothetical protein